MAKSKTGSSSPTITRLLPKSKKNLDYSLNKDYESLSKDMEAVSKEFQSVFKELEEMTEEEIEKIRTGAKNMFFGSQLESFLKAVQEKQKEPKPWTVDNEIKRRNATEKQRNRRQKIKSESKSTELGSQITSVDPQAFVSEGYRGGLSEEFAKLKLENEKLKAELEATKTQLVVATTPAPSFSERVLSWLSLEVEKFVGLVSNFLRK